MDVQNVNAFTELIVSTFETTCSAVPFRFAEFEKFEGDVVNKGELMAVIKFSGTLNGALLMTFSTEVATKIFGAMMQEEITEINEEVTEGFSEILSMIIGNVRATLVDHDLKFEAPKVVAGSGETFADPDTAEWLKIPMAFKEWGKFETYIAIKEKA